MAEAAANSVALQDCSPLLDKVKAEGIVPGLRERPSGGETSEWEGLRPTEAMVLKPLMSSYAAITLWCNKFVVQ